MPKESVRDKGGHVAWVFADGTHIPLTIAMNSSGDVVAPSTPGATEAKQDAVIARIGNAEDTPAQFTTNRRLKDLEDTSDAIQTSVELVRQIDSDNSTTDTLGNGGIFTGDWVDSLGFSLVSVQILTDQDSAASGFRFEQSSTGNADEVSHVHDATVTDNDPTGIHKVYNLTDRYYRVKYTNGTTPQNTFNLKTIQIKNNVQKSHTHSIEFVIDGNHSAQINRSVVTGKKPNGDYVNAEFTAGGNQKISVEEYDDAANPVRKDMEGGGKVEVGTTAVEATFTGTPTHSIIITADLLNTGVLYVGESNVTDAGANAMTFLEAGESVTLDYDDADNAVYVVADAASQNFFKGALI